MLTHSSRFSSLSRAVRCSRCSLVASSLAFLAGLVTNADAAERERKVLIIGIDGMRPDAFIAANAPAMDSLVSQGAACFQVLSEDISLSGPAWSTILSGVHRNKHLVTSNSFIPTNLGAYPHFFSRLQDVCPGVQTASIVHWAPINTNILLGAADVIETYATDLAVRERAVAQLSLPASLGPDVMFLHFDDVDHAGHGFGFSPTVPQYVGAIEATDVHVAQILASLQARPSYASEDWLIVICCDHGGSGTSHGANTPEHRTTMFVFSGASTLRGTTIAGPRTLADVAPTIMSFLGVPVQPSWGWDGSVIGLDMNNSPSQAVSCTQTNFATLLSENFEGVPLGNSVNETPAGTTVWSGSPPTNWTFDDSGVAGNADPNVGMTEWKGWAIAQRTWWSTVAADQGRAAFTLGTGAVAIADCDEWADRGNPTTLGTFNARMRTPQISLAGVRGGVWLSFDSSWRQEGMQRALITVRFDGGGPLPILSWRSEAGPNFKPDATNETVRLAIAPPANAQSMQLEFSLLDGGNNWWWAIDNVRVEGERECDALDFNADSLFPDDQDLIDFLSVLAGGTCSTNTCNDIDFNNDGLFPDDIDLVSFLRVLAGGDC